MSHGSGQAHSAPPAIPSTSSGPGPTLGQGIRTGAEQREKPTTHQQTVTSGGGQGMAGVEVVHV